MRYQCPCCGYFTYSLPLEQSHGDICPVCFWENDIFLNSDSNPSACNHGLTLEQARAGYARIGSCEEAMLAYVRPPREDELVQDNE